MEKVKVAIVGLGTQGSRYLELAEKDKRVEVVSLYDINPALGYDDKKAIDISRDLTVIATPNYQHDFDCCYIICGHRDKTILVEKPIAMLYKNAKLVERLAEEYNVKLIPVVQNRLTPAIKLFFKAIKNMGSIHTVYVNLVWNRNEKYFRDKPWRMDRQQSGGPLYLQFSHYLDIITVAFGDLEEICFSRKSKNKLWFLPFADTGVEVFKMIDGPVITLNYTIANPGGNMESSMIAIGEEGSIKIGGQYMEKVEYLSLKDNGILNEATLLKMVEYPGANEYEGYQGSANMLPQMFDGVIKTVLGEVEPYVDYVSVSKSIHLIDALSGYSDWLGERDDKLLNGNAPQGN